MSKNTMHATAAAYESQDGVVPNFPYVVMVLFDEPVVIHSQDGVVPNFPYVVMVLFDEPVVIHSICNFASGQIQCCCLSFFMLEYHKPFHRWGGAIFYGTSETTSPAGSDEVATSTTATCNEAYLAMRQFVVSITLFHYFHCRCGQLWV